MSGIAVVRYLLANNAPLIAVVPDAKIYAGVVPLNTALPAISVNDVGGQRRNTVSMAEASRLVIERVQVTPLVNSSKKGGGDIPTLKQILALIMTAVPNTNGTVNGVTVDSILPDVRGPNLEDETTGIIEQAQDFIVKYRT